MKWKLQTSYLNKSQGASNENHNFASENIRSWNLQKLEKVLKDLISRGVSEPTQIWFRWVIRIEPETFEIIFASHQKR